MVNRSKILSAVFVCCATVAVSAHAEYPAACLTVQSCVDAAVPAANESCLAATPECLLSDFKTNKTSDRFSASSGALAANAEAIGAKKLGLSSCGNASTKNRCKKCFKIARGVLSIRYGAALFEGLLGNATGIVASHAKDTCSAISE